MTQTDRPRFLLLVKTGQVGFELIRALAPLGDVTALGRQEADFAQPDSLRAIVRKHAPTCIVNAAAHTAVDKAEQEEALALRINGEAPGVLAEEAKRIDAWLVHYSTDYVFDGAKPRPYVENDPTTPLNAYGRTKLAGQRAVAQAGGQHLVFRTSWVYGPRGANFYLTMRRLFRERPELRIVDDQVGAPTSSHTIADATAQVLARVLASNGSRTTGGIYHLVAAGETSWYGFAQAILAHHPPAAGNLAPRLIPIPSQDYPTPARRPLNSRLDTAKLRNAFGVTLPSWQDGLALEAGAG
jgi:dTDP-4-dehydrorhamnose reductase